MLYVEQFVNKSLLPLHGGRSPFLSIPLNPLVVDKSKQLPAFVIEICSFICFNLIKRSLFGVSPPDELIAQRPVTDCF
jgi:hypothetical protein